MKFIDKGGQELHVGDFIVYSQMYGYSLDMRFAKIINLHVKQHYGKDLPKVKVRVVDDADTPFALMTRPITLNFPERMLKVSAFQVPAEVLQLLKDV